MLNDITFPYTMANIPGLRSSASTYASSSLLLTYVLKEACSQKENPSRISIQMRMMIEERQPVWKLSGLPGRTRPEPNTPSSYEVEVTP